MWGKHFRAAFIFHSEVNTPPEILLIQMHNIETYIQKTPLISNILFCVFLSMPSASRDSYSKYETR